MTDGQLLEQFLKHNHPEAFEELVRRHGPMVFGVCQCILMNHHDAEEAFQATFLVLARKARSCVRWNTLAGWLHEVAQRTALNAKRRRAKRHVREQQVAQTPEVSAQENNVWADVVPILDQELSRLPEKYRVAIVLCDLEGQSQKDAAQVLGCPEGTLSSRLTRAREMLRTRLTRCGAAVPTGVLVVAITQRAAWANTPTGLVSLTVQAVRVLSTSSAMTAGFVSPHVAALTEGVLRTMFYAQLKSLAVAISVIVATGLGIGVVYQVAAAQVKPDAKSASGKSNDAQTEQVLQDLQGQWRMVKMNNQGRESPEKTVQDLNSIYTFAGKKIQGQDSTGNEWEGSMKLDLTKSPAEIDIQDVIHPKKGKLPDIMGTFKLEGETLIIHMVFHRNGKGGNGNFVSRPTDLTKTVPGNLGADDVLITLQRQPKKDANK